MQSTGITMSERDKAVEQVRLFLFERDIPLDVMKEWYRADSYPGDYMHYYLIGRLITDYTIVDEDLYLDL